MLVSNVNVYGLFESMVASGYPMKADMYSPKEFKAEVENLKYITKNVQFISDFLKYQKQYGKWKYTNGDVCEFCGSSNNIQNVNMGNEKHKLCSRHSHQFYKYGKVWELTPKYELLDDCVKVTIIGDMKKQTDYYFSYQDLPYIFYEKLHNAGKYCVNEDGIAIHRMLLGASNPNILVDHIDKNTFNNRRSNLRICTIQENIRNSSKKNGKNTYTGVNYDITRKSWRAYITVNNKQIFLGRFDTEKEALIARLTAEAIYFKEFAPQINLFKQYGINFDIPIYKEDSINFKKSINHFRRLCNLANTPMGTGHSNALKGVIVQMDVKAPQYFWQQLQRYHYIDFVSSQSKMHCINKMELEKLCMLSTNYEAINNAKESVKYYDSGEINIDDCLSNIPMGLEYTARMTTNYLQLKTIYHQRKHHRSKQWKDFCEWIETLPYAHQLIITSGVDK